MEKLLRLLDIDYFKKYLERVGGEDALRVVPLVVEAGNFVTDEQIANKMGVKVTVVRAVFNRLHFWGMADYKKERDEETGWYTYNWFLLEEKIVNGVLEDLENNIKELEEKIAELEEFMFFDCPEGHERMAFEVAAEYEFKCPHCGSDLVPANVSAEKERLKEMKEVYNTIKNICTSDESKGNG